MIETKRNFHSHGTQTNGDSPNGRYKFGPHLNTRRSPFNTDNAFRRFRVEAEKIRQNGGHTPRFRHPFRARPPPFGRLRPDSWLARCERDGGKRHACAKETAAPCTEQRRHLFLSSARLPASDSVLDRRSARHVSFVKILCVQVLWTCNVTVSCVTVSGTRMPGISLC